MIRHIKTIAAALTLAACAPALADSVYLGAWSTHLVDNGQINDNHALVALEKNGWALGHYNNSWGEPGYFVAREKLIGRWKDFRVSAFLGAVYGYRDCTSTEWNEEDDRTVCPALAPVVSYTRYDIQPSVIVLGDAVAFSFRIKF